MRTTYRAAVVICVALLSGAGLLYLNPVPIVVIMVTAIVAIATFMNLGLGVFLLLSVYACCQAIFSDIIAIETNSLTVNSSQIFIVVAIMLIGGRLCASGIREGGIRFPPSAILLQVPFVIWTTLAMLWTNNHLGTSSLARVWAGVFFAGTGYWVARSSTVRWIPYTVAVVSAIAGISAYLERMVGSQMQGAVSFVFRAEGSFGHPNDTAAVAFVGMPVFSSMWIDPRTRWDRSIALAGFATIGFAVVFTLSRTLVLGVMLFVCFALISLRSTSKPIAKVVLTLVPVILIIGSLYFVPENYLEARVRDIPGVDQPGLPGEAGSGRIALWASLCELISVSSASEIIYGHGVQAVTEDLLKVYGLGYDAHNDFLEVAYDLGIVGLALYLFGIAILIRALVNMMSQRIEMEHEYRLWLAYVYALLLSTIMFHVTVYSLGPRLLTYVGIGYLLGCRNKECDRAGLPSCAR